MRPAYRRRFVLALLPLFAVIGVARGDEEIRLPSQPDLSPDGKIVVFGWRGDIWTASSSGGRARRLTSHSGRDQQPKFSPDGKHIAFISDRGLGNQAFVVAASGGEPRALTAHTEGYGLEGWYPDGEHLLVSGRRDHFWKKHDRLLRIDALKPGGERPVFDDYGF